MNDAAPRFDPTTHPEYGELLQAIAELSLISHASTQQFDGERGGNSTEDIGGKRPPGGDMDRPGRDASTDERMAWFSSYQRKTPAYFRRELERCKTVEQLECLGRECREVIRAWKVGPLGGAEPKSRHDPRWKRWVFESEADAGVLAHQFGVTRRYINKIRQQEGVIVWLEQQHEAV